MFDRLIHRWLRVPYKLYVHDFQAPKQPRATVVLIHGIGSLSEMWQRVVGRRRIDKMTRVLAVDLLGFGNSPRPHWKTYDVKTQVDSLVATLARQKVDGRIILVGHSLGALVAVHAARYYPSLIDSLILCSPPLYHQQGKDRLAERQLRALYQKIIDKPALGKVIASDFAKKYKLFNPGFLVDESNLQIFLDTLDAAIINQKALTEIAELTMPVEIFYGQFDPVIINKNLRKLAKQKHIAVTKILASHEIDKRYGQVVAQAINRHAIGDDYGQA